MISGAWLPRARTSFETALRASSGRTETSGRVNARSVRPEERSVLICVKGCVSPAGRLRSKRFAALSQPRDFHPLSPCPGFLLAPAPSLNLHHGTERFGAGSELFRMNQFDRSPRSRVAADRAPLMLGEALLKVVGVAHVVRPVSASQEVDPEPHRCSPSQIGSGTEAPFETARKTCASSGRTDLSYRQPEGSA